MKKFLKNSWPFFFFAILTAFFLWKVFLKNYVPIPGDILIGQYFPWRDYIWESKIAFPLKNFELYDVVAQLYPWRQFAMESFKAGFFPLWNPYNLMGSPHLANLPTAAFYPLNLIFFFLPFVKAWTFYISLQTLLSGFLMHLYLKNLKLTKMASVFGGVAFAFSSFMMMRYEFGVTGHTFLWLPLVLLSIDQIKKQFSLKWWFGGIAGLTMMFLGGYLQALLYGLGVAIAYALFRFFEGSRLKQLSFKYFQKNNFVFWLLLFIIPVLLAMVQILPFLETIKSSSRLGMYNQTDTAYESHFLTFGKLITALVPDFFGNPATQNFWGNTPYQELAFYNGLVVFLFFLLSVFYLREKTVKFWLVIFFLTFLFLFKNPLARIPYILRIPGYEALLPSRLISVVDLCLPILAAFGLSFWQKSKDDKERFKLILKPLLVLIIIFLGLWLTVLFLPKISPNWTAKMAIAKRNSLLPSFYLIFTSSLIVLSRIWPRRKNHILVFLLLLLTAFDLLRQARKYNSFVPENLVFPSTKITEFLSQAKIPPRVMITHSELLPVNSNLFYKIAMLDIYDSVHDRRAEELLAVLNNQDVEAWSFQSGRATFSVSVKSPAIDLLSPDYILTLDTELPTPRFKLVLQEGRTRVYQNQSSYPRVFLTKDILLEKDEKKTLKEVLSLASYGEKKAVLTEAIFLNTESLEKKSSAEITNYQPNQVGVKTSSNTEALLVINDTYNQGWQVFIDGKSDKLLRTNYALRGVKVPAGEHQVVFQYNPPSFTIGVYTSGGTLLVILIGGIFISRRKER